jgi:hypothetical protein
MQPAKGVKPKKEGKLRSAVIWYNALQQEGVKQTGVKQGLGVYVKHARFEVFTAVLRRYPSRWL